MRICHYSSTQADIAISKSTFQPSNTASFERERLRPEDVFCVSSFRKTHAHLFRSESELDYLIRNRSSNGLESCGRPDSSNGFGLGLFLFPSTRFSFIDTQSTLARHENPTGWRNASQVARLALCLCRHRTMPVSAGTKRPSRCVTRT